MIEKNLDPVEEVNELENDEELPFTDIEESFFIKYLEATELQVDYTEQFNSLIELSNRSIYLTEFIVFQLFVITILLITIIFRGVKK